MDRQEKQLYEAETIRQTKEHHENYHKSCRECDGDTALIRNNWCLRCKKVEGGVGVNAYYPIPPE